MTQFHSQRILLDSKEFLGRSVNPFIYYSPPQEQIIIFVNKVILLQMHFQGGYSPGSPHQYYFLPGIHKIKKTQPTTDKLKKKHMKFQHDESLPQIDIKYQKKKSNELINNKPKAQKQQIQEKSNKPLRKVYSENKLVGHLKINQQKKMNRQLNRKIENFQKNKLKSLEISPQKGGKSLPKKPSNQKIGNNSIRKYQRKQSPSKSPLLKNMPTEESKGTLQRKIESPSKKIYQSIYLKKNEKKSSFLKTPNNMLQQGYNTLGIYDSNPTITNSSNIKKTLEEKLTEINNRLEKTQDTPLIKDHILKISQKEALSPRKSEPTYKFTHMEIEEYENKVTKLKEMGEDYMERYLQFQQILLQLKLYRDSKSIEQAAEMRTAEN